MSKTTIPDNIEFFKKNSKNLLSVTLDSSVVLTIDESKSIGQSEVNINVLGIPRSETRGVIHEDVSSYSLNPNNWVTEVTPSSNDGFPNPSDSTDPNFKAVNFGRVLKSYTKPGITVLKGIWQGWDPEAYDIIAKNCGGYSVLIKQKDKYGLNDYTFLPVIYHNKATSCIGMEAWPPDYGYDIPLQPSYAQCVPPPGQVIKPVNRSLINYKCVLESRETYKYEPGKVIGFTFGVSTSVKDTLGFNYESGVNEHKKARWGVRNSTDAYFFLLDGTELKLVKESTYPNNSVTITKDNFLDKLDGTGTSKAVIDYSKVTMYSIEYSWYGAIGATFFVYLPVGNSKSRWVKIGEIPSSNVNFRPALSDPYMKMFLELEVPHRVKSPHFLKKYGTSVYTDGVGFNSKSFAKSRSFTTPIKKLDYNFYKNIFTIEVPEKSETGVSKYNRRIFKPITLEAYFDKDVILTVDRVLDNEKVHFSMPAIIIGLSGVPLLSEFFYDGSGRRLNKYNPLDSNNGQLRDFSEDYFDYILPIAEDVYNDAGSATVLVPNKYSLNKVIESLLNNFPHIHDPLLENRLVSENLFFNDFVFNDIKGVCCLAHINSITISKNQDTNIGYKIVLGVGIGQPVNVGGGFISNKDGRIRKDVLSLDHLTDTFIQELGGTQNYPNYGPNHIGTQGYSRISGLGFLQRPFGGNKTEGTPLYDSNSEVCVNKNYYRNNSCYIANAKIGTGTIRFSYPVGPYAAGLIEESKIETLKEKNFFKDYDFLSEYQNIVSTKSEATFYAKDYNIQGYLFSNSLIKNFRYVYYVKRGADPYYGRIKNGIQVPGTVGDYYYIDTYNPPLLKSDFATYYRAGPYLAQSINMMNYNYSQYLYVSPHWPLFTRKSNKISGYDINKYKIKIKLEGNQSDSFSSFNFLDFSYILNGTYTQSRNMWLVFLNNIYRMNLASLKYKGVKITDARFNVAGGTSNRYIEPLDVTAVIYSNQIRNLGYGGILDLEIRTINPINDIRVRNIDYNYDAFSEIYNNDLSLASTIVVSPEENLYFYCYGNTDLNSQYETSYYYRSNTDDTRSNLPTTYGGYNPVNFPSEDISPIKPVNSLDNKFCIFKFDVADNNGIKSNNLSPLIMQDKELEKDLWVKDYSILDPTKLYTEPVNIKLSPLLKNGIGYTQSPRKKEGSFDTIRIYTDDNDYSQYTDRKNISTRKYNFFVPKNKKFTINFEKIFNAAGEKVLPSLGSSYYVFDTFFIVKGRSVETGETATGFVTFNYEEQV